jgi:hypothetical protein
MGRLSHRARSLQVERQLVQDVLHACQGMDGLYLSLGVPGDHPTSLTGEGRRALSPAQRSLLLDLAALGTLYRCARARPSHSEPLCPRCTWGHAALGLHLGLCW